MASWNFKIQVSTFFFFVMSPSNEGYKTSLVSPRVVDFTVVKRCAHVNYS